MKQFFSNPPCHLLKTFIKLKTSILSFLFKYVNLYHMPLVLYSDKLINICTYFDGCSILQMVVDRIFFSLLCIQCYFNLLQTIYFKKMVSMVYFCRPKLRLAMKCPS